MSTGWIKLSRNLLDHEVWHLDKFSDGQAWVDLLMLANHKKGSIKVRGIRIDIDVGQCGYSKEALATRWKWSRGKVLRFLKYLETRKMIKIVHQECKVIALISILKYTVYQSSSTISNATNVSTSEQPTNTNKNEKNEKNRLRTYCRPPRPSSQHSWSESQKKWIVK